MAEQWDKFGSDSSSSGNEDDDEEEEEDEFEVNTAQGEIVEKVASEVPNQQVSVKEEQVEEVKEVP